MLGQGPRLLTKKQEEKLAEDLAMREKARKINADSTIFNKALDTAKEAFTRLYGEEPDESSDLWKWFVTEVYDKFIRLAVTSTIQKPNK